MPELPDISLYIEALRERIHGRRLERARVVSPFLLRSVEPGVDEALGLRVVDFRRLGKRIAIGFETDLWFVIHLMIAGRFQWRPTWPDKPSRLTALVLGFEGGVLMLTEAGTKKRASLYVVRGADALAVHDPGGLELAAITSKEFLSALRSGNHTLKRALTDPRLLSGIGNAYSDEILHRARLSPVLLTSRLSDDEGSRLHRATLEVLDEWTQRLRHQSAGEFPSKVTAFHSEMAVHGRYGLPCPVCGTKVQRIRYADNETNYCPRCQTGGKLLADRSLSRLLKSDWPKSIDELEQLRREARGS
jgi:formamidopyrimidine-DNA glycosylase